MQRKMIEAIWSVSVERIGENIRSGRNWNVFKTLSFVFIVQFKDQDRLA